MQDNFDRVESFDLESDARQMTLAIKESLEVPQKKEEGLFIKLQEERDYTNVVKF
jgi:hypothetical protein